jgi:hypothetical protein
VILKKSKTTKSGKNGSLKKAKEVSYWRDEYAAWK